MPKGHPFTEARKSLTLLLVKELENHVLKDAPQLVVLKSPM